MPNAKESHSLYSSIRFWEYCSGSWIFVRLWWLPDSWETKLCVQAYYLHFLEAKKKDTYHHVWLRYKALSWWWIQHVMMVVARRENLSELPSQAACFDPLLQLWQASAKDRSFPSMILESRLLNHRSPDLRLKVKTVPSGSDVQVQPAELSWLEMTLH